jgi:hypothetical protein
MDRVSTLDGGAALRATPDTADAQRSVRLGLAGTIAFAALGLVGSAQAAPDVRAQLRFQVTPHAEASDWTAHPNLKFQKSGECYYSTAAAPAAAWPVSPAQQAGHSQATAPLFNPGFPLPNGGYDTSGPDDGFNTLFFTVNATPAAKSLVCRGTILANGKDVTADAPGRVSASSLGAIATYGPPTVSVHVDPTKLASLLGPAKPGIGALGPSKGAPPSAFSPPIRHQGTQLLHEGQWLDLDMGKAAGPMTNVRFQMPYSLMAIAPAAFGKDISKTGTDKPHGWAGCKAVMSSKVGEVTAALGRYHCMMTQQGRLAEVKVAQAVVDPNDPKHKTMIYLAYTVWEK